MKTALVVPSNRVNVITDFLLHLQHEPFDMFILVEDTPETFSGPLPGYTHCSPSYSWKEIEKILGENAWIISKQDSAIRSFGFLQAYNLGADVIMTLDDDCRTDGRFAENHLKQLYDTPKWTESIPGFKTRGMPYYNLGKLDVMLNVGLWSGIPDQDSIQQITNPIINYLPNVYDRVLPMGQYVPICGMNLAFRRELTPLMYFPLMGKDQPYSRFDDIWCGIIVKKICDHLGYSITCGHPYVEHTRASDPLTNLVKEAPGIKANESFWQEIDEIKLSGTTPKECMNEIGNVLVEKYDAYLAKLGKAIAIWVSYF